ncbi:MAG: hypothetical protein ACRD5H_00805 [Nitrososphaerales archaeon]
MDFEDALIGQHHSVRKISMKFSINKSPSIVPKMNQHLAFSKSDGKWRIWGRDHFGLYSIVLGPENFDQKSKKPKRPRSSIKRL